MWWMRTMALVPYHTLKTANRALIPTNLWEMHSYVCRMRIQLFIDQISSWEIAQNHNTAIPMESNALSIRKLAAEIVQTHEASIPLYIIVRSGCSSFC